MIAYLRGRIIAKSEDGVIIDAGGVGYEVTLSPYSVSLLPPEGTEAEIYVAESITMYGGTNLYGFRSAEEKKLFEILKNVPGAGGKKALEYLGKAQKSIPDFVSAVREKDPKRLRAVFGFTMKTAEKLIASLQDKIPQDFIKNTGNVSGLRSDIYARAVDALLSLGFRPLEARNAVETAAEEAGREAGTETLIRFALKHLNQ